MSASSIVLGLVLLSIAPFLIRVAHTLVVVPLLYCCAAIADSWRDIFWFFSRRPR